MHSGYWGSAKYMMELPWWLSVKESLRNAGVAGDEGSVYGLGRSSRGGHDKSLQYSCLENLTDRGAWWATVHRVTKSRTQLKEFDMHSSGSRDHPTVPQGIEDFGVTFCVLVLGAILSRKATRRQGGNLQGCSWYLYFLPVLAHGYVARLWKMSAL